jgi:hypothetical protein
MHLPKWLAVPLVALTLPATAQLAAQDPDWKELDAPPPPAFELSRLLPFEVSAGSTLKFGIDPATLQLGSDGILRYVVVARSSTGTVNAMYEGLRCSTGEVRTYARCQQRLRRRQQRMEIHLEQPAFPPHTDVCKARGLRGQRTAAHDAGRCA